MHASMDYCIASFSRNTYHDDRAVALVAAHHHTRIPMQNRDNLSTAFQPPRSQIASQATNILSVPISYHYFAHFNALTTH
jgi:hypothetical protein